MLAECSLVMLGVNALLFFTSLLEKISARVLLGAGLILATVGLAVLARNLSDTWMYLGVSFTAAGTGVVLLVLSYLAAGATRQKLGITMGGLAAAGGFGQTLGSGVGGWFFGTFAHLTFGWLILPLLVMLGLLVVRPGWWSVIPAESAHATTRPATKSRQANL